MPSITSQNPRCTGRRTTSTVTAALHQRCRPEKKMSGRSRIFSAFLIFLGLRLGTPAVHDANNGIGATENGRIPFPTSIGNELVLCWRWRSRGGGRPCAFPPLFPPTPVLWPAKSAGCLSTTRFVMAGTITEGGARKNTEGGGGYLGWRSCIRA